PWRPASARSRGWKPPPPPAAAPPMAASSPPWAPRWWSWARSTPPSTRWTSVYAPAIWTCSPRSTTRPSSSCWRPEHADLPAVPEPSRRRGEWRRLRHRPPLRPRPPGLPGPLAGAAQEEPCPGRQPGHGGGAPALSGWRSLCPAGPAPGGTGGRLRPRTLAGYRLWRGLLHRPDRRATAASRWLCPGHLPRGSQARLPPRAAADLDGGQHGPRAAGRRKLQPAGQRV